MPPLPEAGASIPPFFCIFGFICFCEMSPDLLMVFAPDAPDGDSVAPLAFGVPIPVPPWPAPAAPPLVPRTLREGGARQNQNES